MRTTALLATLCFGTSVAASAAAAPRGNDTEHSTRASLRAELKYYLRTRKAPEHVSGVSLRVTYRGRKPSVSIPIGTTRYRGGAPISVHDLWQIGSNTKAFTSVILLQLEAEHKLSIHDTLGKWLPRYRAWRHIRIKRLLNMTSGIQDYLGKPAFLRAYAAAPNTVFSRPQLVSYVAHAPLESGWNYSNTNYILAQMIIEKATHDTYRHQLRKRIVEPLDLGNLHYRRTEYPRRVRSRLPAGYFFDSSIPQLAPFLGKNQRRRNLSYAQGAGGIVSSIRDVARWDRALYRGRELPSKQQRELKSLVSQQTGKPIRHTTSSDPQGFGLGVAQAKTGLGKLWFYEGSTLGYRVLHLYRPQSGTVIVLGVNSATNDDELSALGLAIVQILQNAGT